MGFKFLLFSPLFNMGSDVKENEYSSEVLEFLSRAKTNGIHAVSTVCVCVCVGGHFYDDESAVDIYCNKWLLLLRKCKGNNFSHLLNNIIFYLFHYCFGLIYSCFVLLLILLQ